MVKVYYVKAYDWPANQRRRFVINADNAVQAENQIKHDYPQLSEVSARFLLNADEGIYEELT
jgi:hypothetical protein